VPKPTPQQFFADLQLAFRLQFGREMTAQERTFFGLAQRAVASEEEKRDHGDQNDETKSA
jgi:hypothetical protein